ncbi:MAG: branched-chain amino acid ABC transporter permease, partial [Actinobacteria bacterium]|nr:branched-chain amino acid ABC transporter permease [Actinomycetota bacterium]
MRGSVRIKPLQSIAVVLITTWLVCLPFVSTTTELRQHTQVIIAVLAVLGVNIATGYGGMISLGHGVFVGIGAFATG